MKGHLFQVGAGVLAAFLFVVPWGRSDGPAARSQAVSRDAARAAFARIQRLEGKWHAKSTRGWTDAFELRKLARGTAVGMLSFAGNLESAMVTVFHLDGDRLMVTHYCEAGNHPRLAATSYEDGGRKITFTFLDATNLASRDAGHMDKLVLALIDDDHFNEQWTWYQNGNERWMEAIENQRVGPTEAKP